MHAVKLNQSNEPLPPLDTRFKLGPEMTDVQARFLEKHGFLVFDQVINMDEVNRMTSEIERIGEEWVKDGVRKVNGVPLFRGKDHEGHPFIQRLAFTSMHSEYIKSILHDPRFDPVRRLIGENARVGDQEKDGAVVSRYINCPGSVYPRLGWHTDGLRDVFYLRAPKQMLNIGLHFDECNEDDGGLRLIPGTHDQGFWDTIFRKANFISHDVDPNELKVETKPGDLTIHDGRLWHRVQKSEHKGAKSLRRVMYVPYLTDKFQPKNENSSTPVYHHLSKLMCWYKRNFN
jgi:phytanoyl-CoA hydroxylase